MLPEFTSYRATHLAVSPQLEKFSAELVKEYRFDFDLLADRGNETAKQFGLVFILSNDLRKLYLQFGIDLQEYNGDDSWTLPVPARFVIDQDSIIRSVDADPDYTRRPEPEDTLRELKALA